MLPSFTVTSQWKSHLDERFLWRNSILASDMMLGGQWQRRGERRGKEKWEPERCKKENLHTTEERLNCPVMAIPHLQHSSHSPAKEGYVRKCYAQKSPPQRTLVSPDITSTLHLQTDWPIIHEGGRRGVWIEPVPFILYPQWLEESQE